MPRVRHNIGSLRHFTLKLTTWEREDNTAHLPRVAAGYAGGGGYLWVSGDEHVNRCRRGTGTTGEEPNRNIMEEYKLESGTVDTVDQATVRDHAPQMTS